MFFIKITNTSPVLTGDKEKEDQMGIKSILLTIVLLLSFSAQAGLRLATYNIRNFDYDQRSHVPTNKSQLKLNIDEVNADLLAVQEINQVDVFKSFISNNYFNRYEVALTNCGGSHNQRLGFVYDRSKFTLVSFHEDMRTVDPKNQKNEFCEGSRPLAVAHFKMKNKNQQDLIAISVHLKSGGHPKSVQKRFQQLSILNDVVNSFYAQGIYNIVIMGDFNSTEYQHKTGNYQKFNRLVSNMNLIDTSKDAKCTSYWWGGVQDGMQHPSVLDHIIVSPTLLDGAPTPKAKPLAHCQKLSCWPTRDEEMGVNYDEVSDHCPVVSEIK